MNNSTLIIIFIAVAVVLAVAGFFCGLLYRKKIAEKQIGSAEQEAERILNEAQKQATSQKKEIILEGKEEVLKQRRETEKDLSIRQKEVRKQERRIQQKEETIDRKLENIERRESNISKKEKQVTAKLADIDKLKDLELDKLQEISGFSLTQAKQYLLQKVDEDLLHEKNVKILEMEQRLKEESIVKAKKIISLAIQKCAVEQVNEVTTSVIQLPSDEMKGRIIGREGRNIRAIEASTGVDLIIDDTPETITISSFDPVRREIARLSIEKLILDGRIHPAKIEEIVRKYQREVNVTMKREGERAVLEMGITGMHPELVKLLGRLMYRTSYGQNVLTHSLEVAYLSGVIASELGLNPKYPRRAGLLHDIGKAVDHEREGSHIEIGVDLTKKYKESKEVIHAIHAHHGDVEPETLTACIVQAADSISAARPGARKENLENYIKRLKDLEELALSFDGVEKSFAMQAGREIRVIVKPEIVKDERMIPLARELCKRIESELEYPGQVKVNIIRENRAIEFAK